MENKKGMTHPPVEEELQRLKEQLVESEKLASLGLLTTGIAHEINNPINFISSGITALEENLKVLKTLVSLYHAIDPSDPVEQLMHARKYYEQIHYEELQEEIENLLKAIRTGSTRAAKIVSSLQKFSSHTDKPAAVNINEIIEDTLALFHSEVKYDIELHKKLSVNLPPLQVLSVELSQVFFNMIINAIQAMNGHGILRIETGLSNGQILIRIADNGPGISKENIDKIFDAFFTTKEVGKGTGLGLYISKKIIEGYGGTIVAHSKFGEGTEFEIRIPVDVQAD